MIRSALRLVGFLLLAAAIAVLAVDAWRSFSARRLILTPVADTAAALAPAKTAMLRAAIGARLDPWLDHTIGLIAAAPSVAALGAAAALAFWLARPPRPTIGYSSR